MESNAHVSSVKSYGLVLGALLTLTVVTVSAASVDLGSFNVVIALGIATIKASLVALFFMHLRHGRPMNGIIFVSGVIFLGIFLMFCLIDADTRDVPRPTRLITAPAAAAPVPGPAAGH
ncbi:MAG: cytochrome C oxidase subunit IV family protein [Bryobacteraceae bacterium]